MPKPKPGLRQTLACLLGFGVVVLGVRGTQDAVANGDTRSITIRHMHTKEETTVTFRRDGRYVSEGLEKLNWALRDWRSDEPIRMDPRLFDLAWEVHRRVGSEQPFHVVSAYRSPGTNSMLRRRSRGVAKHSQHMLGKAMDFYLPDTPTVRIREAGMVLQRGGVGFYPGAHTPFVHLDAGSVRSWPRMTRDQLVRLFPDEKTVHLPADGQPLGNYELAKAEILSRGGAVAGYAAADLDEGAIISSGRKSLWASLFGGDEEEADARPTRGGRRAASRPAPTVMAYARDSGNSDDADRFATVREPVAPVEQALVRERTQRLAPRVAAPEAQIAAAAASAPPPQPAAPAVDDRRPRLIDAPIPLARPRGLTGPASEPQTTQVAALPGPAGALGFQAATATDGKLVPAALPPRRPDAMGSLVETVIAGTPIQAPAPPLRPAALASLYSQPEKTQAQPEGRLVSVSHPLPPVRERPEGYALASAPTGRPAPAAAPTPIVAAYDADRSGLNSLFAAVSRPEAPAKPVKVATARAKATSAGHATIQSPGPAAALGFSHADPSDAKTGSFSGPAVRPLPTNFVQN